MNIKLEDIRLSYSYKTVLNGVTLGFEAGRIHALLGENGAGKSSLVKILTGAVKPTGGKILLDEKEVVFKNPSDSLNCGIACVYQRPFLADSLTVRENLRIGMKSSDIRKRSNLVFSETVEPKSKHSKLTHFYVCGTEIKYNKKISSLSGSERFLVAFSSALLRSPKILILDEPTVFLNPKQAEALFIRLRSLSDSGVNVIVITHKGSDLKYCDDRILLDEGNVCQPKKSVLSASETEGSFEKNQFENSSSLDSNIKNDVRFNSDITSITSPKSHFTESDFQKYRSHGNVGIIPSKNTYLASDPNLTIAQVLYPAVQIAIHNQKKTKEIEGGLNDGRMSQAKSEKEITLEIIKKAGINIRPEEKAFNLSGGMLQRLILERELWNNPEMIVLENPYQGLDVASCQQLKSRLDELEKRGVHIIQ